MDLCRLFRLPLQQQADMDLHELLAAHFEKSELLKKARPKDDRNLRKLTPKCPGATTQCMATFERACKLMSIWLLGWLGSGYTECE